VAPAPAVVAEPEQDFEPEPAPLPRQGGVKFGPMTVILVSLLAGVAAFLLSRLIPF
jgi:hypothetical protein